MVKYFQVFIASPGDLLKQRELLKDILEKFNTGSEFKSKYRLIGREFGDVRLGENDEEPPVDPEAYLLSPAEADICIGLFAEMLGSPTKLILNPKTKQPYQGRTEYELLTANERRLSSADGKPELFLCRRILPLHDHDSQQQLVDALLQQVGEPIHSFRDDDELATLLEKHIEEFLERQESAPEPAPPEPEAAQGKPELPVSISTDDDSGFHPTFYVNTFIDQYENYSLTMTKVRRAEESPIVEPIVRANLHDHYVPLQCTDTHQKTMELSTYVHTWLQQDQQQDQHGTVIVLGEYGFGKTSYCLALTYELLKLYQLQPEASILPIYLAFRDFIAYDERDLTAEQKIFNILRIKYKILSDNVNFPQILKGKRILLILDGLDEIEKTLKSSYAKRKLQYIEATIRNSFKVIMTCRINFLPSSQDVQYVVTMSSEQRDIIDRIVDIPHLEILTLASFDDKHIERYLFKVISDDQERDKLLKAIQRIPDLPDLAKRPILLRMVVEAFQKKLVDFNNTKHVTAAVLYDSFTREWLDRDFLADRADLSAEEKRPLLEQLALKLYKDPSEQIHIEDLVHEVRRCFKDLSEDHLDSCIKEFVVCTFFRPAQDKHFSFAHRSIMEFFVARALLRYINDDEPESFGEDHKLRIGLVAQFLAELIRIDKLDNAEKRLRDWLILGRKEPNIGRFLSSNAATVLCRLEFAFRELYDLRGISLTESDLSFGNLRGCDLRDTNFDNAVLEGTDFTSSNLSNANFSNAFMRGTVFQSATLRNASFKNIRMIGGPNTLWIALYDKAKRHVVVGTDWGDLVIVPLKDKSQKTLTIHVNDSGVLNCAFSPDGQTLAVADRDRIHPRIYLYDWPKLLSGELVRSAFDNGGDYVRWMEFSPDGKVLASGDRGAMVKLWHLGTDTHVTPLKYHYKPVMWVRWSPKRNLLVSGGYDGMLCLWQPEGNTAKRSVIFDENIPEQTVDKAKYRLAHGIINKDGKLESEIIRSLAFNSTGTILASGAEDSLIKLWDVSDPTYGRLKSVILCDSPVFCLAFTESDKILLAGDDKGRLYRIDAETWSILQKKVDAHSDIVRSFDLDEEAGILLTSAWDQTSRTWHTAHLAQADLIYTIAEDKVAYKPEDAFKGANITGMRHVSALFKRYFVRLGAIDEPTEPEKPDEMPDDSWVDPAPMSFVKTVPPGSILIVTVTKVEVQAVGRMFSQAAGKKCARQTIGLGQEIYYDLGLHGGVQAYMVQSGMGTSPVNGALLTIRNAIDDVHPRAIVMCGIAFGMRPDHQKLGDVLIAEQLRSYEPQKVDLRKGRLPRGVRVMASPSLLRRARGLENEWRGATVHFGPVLSGEKLINDPAFLKQLLKLEPEAIGGDMEGAGLYAAATDANVDWILVKAICDWADGEKNYDAQPVAAQNAAQFVLRMLQLGGWSGQAQGEPPDPDISGSTRSGGTER